MKFGRYELLSKLGEGGMGELFIAAESVPTPNGPTRRLVALKRILVEFSQHPQFVRSFLNEARLSAQLHHSNIVEIFDFGQHAQLYFIAMEYVDGIDLAALLKHQRKENQPMPVEAALSIVSDALLALDYAHRTTTADGRALGIVHRDATPSNIVINRQGVAKVLDFGIAKATEDDSQDRTRTATGTRKGKITYLAPEQVRAENIDRRVDIFALGVVLYQVLTNVSPFKHDTELETLQCISDGVYPDLRSVRPELHTDLAAVVGKALARDRDARFEACAEFHAALQKAAAAAGISPSHAAVAKYLAAHAAWIDRAPLSHSAAAPEGTRSFLVAATRRSRWSWPALGAASLILLLFVFLRWTKSPTPTLLPPPAPAVAASMPSASPTPRELPAATEKRIDRVAPRAAPTPAAIPAKLIVFVDPWGQVSVDDHDFGLTPLQPIALAPGAHSVVIKNDDKRVVRQINLGSGERRVLRVDLTQ